MSSLSTPVTEWRPCCVEPLLPAVQALSGVLTPCGQVQPGPGGRPGYQSFRTGREPRRPLQSLCVFSHSTSDTKCVGVFHTSISSPTLHPPQEVLEFNSMFILTTRAQYQIPQAKGSVKQAHPHFRCQSQVLGAQGTHTAL